MTEYCASKRSIAGTVNGIVLDKVMVNVLPLLKIGGG